jgi:hypothetical protein
MYTTSYAAYGRIILIRSLRIGQKKKIKKEKKERKKEKGRREERPGEE